VVVSSELRKPTVANVDVAGFMMSRLENSGSFMQISARDVTVRFPSGKGIPVLSLRLNKNNR